MTLTPAEIEVHRKAMRPIRSRPYISIAIPSSLTTDGKTIREQTVKIGLIGRALAIFRVETVAVYSDGEGDAELIRSILSCMETPPYLKKFLVPLSPKLRYIGLIPPLKTPHHVEPEVFDTVYREGIIIDRERDRCLIDIGLGKKGVVYGSCPKRGTRVTVKIIKEEQNYYRVEIVSKSVVDVYWGYAIQYFGSLKELLEDAGKHNSLVIVASKKGRPIYEVEEDVADKLRIKDEVLIVFGGPYLDVDEIAQRENIALEDFADLVINFIPRQGSANVRTEEAIIATLSIVNYLKEKLHRSSVEGGTCREQP